jgi:hypothetical protein
MYLEGTIMYLEGIHMYTFQIYVKHNNVFSMINRYILKDTKVFESFINAFGCIYSILHRIGSVFQCNSMHL